MQIQEGELPGVGTRYVLTTREGTRLVVVARRDGGWELGVMDDPRDPDACRTLTRLLGTEARELAELLAGRAV